MKVVVNGWSYTFKKQSMKYSRVIPARMEARKNFSAEAAGKSYAGGYQYRDVADVLIVAYEGGHSTISMNGTAPMNTFDIIEMRDAMSYAQDALDKGLYR